MFDPNFSKGVAIVAGGSGGIGSAICKELAAAGSDVVLTYRSNAAGAATVCNDIRAIGRQAEAFPLALEEAESTADFVRSVVERWGAIHSLVSAAGPKLEFAYASAIAPAEWKRVMDVDVNGCFNLVSAVVPYMRAQKTGSIVSLITPAVDRYPVQDILSAAPKAAIEILMRGIAKEEGRYGLRANAVGPGFIDAGLGHDMLVRPGYEDFSEGLRKSLPLKRFGAAEDVANAVVFLLSSKASYITGQSLSVDGGLQI
jgi:NAD(P)-dependent dehydrogenase (short-subunit alcohol dehydrogenase family)